MNEVFVYYWLQKLIFLIKLKYLIVGLGNIGVEYAETRHNIGFMVMDELAKEFKLTFKSVQHGAGAELSHKSRAYFLLKPNTYMNLSGKAVAHHLRALKIPLENLLVVTDDLALPFGTVRIRKEGSDGGHNGLKSINESLATTKYPRLRIGIDKNYAPGRQVDYVLSPFSPKEKPYLPEICGHCGQACLAFGFLGVEQTMTLFNKALVNP